MPMMLTQQIIITICAGAQSTKKCTKKSINYCAFFLIKILDKLRLKAYIINIRLIKNLINKKIFRGEKNE